MLPLHLFSFQYVYFVSIVGMDTFNKKNETNNHFISNCFCLVVLSNAQVAAILQVSANSAVNRDEELNDVYRKTQKYVNRFNTMTNPEKEHQELVDELDNLQGYVCVQFSTYCCWFAGFLLHLFCFLFLFSKYCC